MYNFFELFSRNFIFLVFAVNINYTFIEPAGMWVRDVENPINQRCSAPYPMPRDVPVLARHVVGRPLVIQQGSPKDQRDHSDL